MTGYASATAISPIDAAGSLTSGSMMNVQLSQAGADCHDQRVDQASAVTAWNPVAQEPDDRDRHQDEAAEVERIGDRWEWLQPHPVQDHPRPVPRHRQRQPDRER